MPATLAWPQRTAAVWRFDIDTLSAEADDHLAAFTVQERERAARALTPHARRTFKASRWALRKTLARYLACAPGEVVIVAGPHGKPQLGDARLHFNVSHSGLHLMIAVADAPIGIDVECGHAGLSVDGLCEQIAPAEAGAIRAAPSSERRQLLLRCWARKEAVAKATGLGLRLPLRSYAVPLQPLARARPVTLAGHGRWWLHDLPAPAGACAALASARPLRIEAPAAREN